MFLSFNYAVGLLTRASTAKKISFCGGAFRMVDLYSTRSRSLHVRSKCAGIRKHVFDSDCVIKNSALNCSTGSNVVVLFELQITS